MEVVKTSIVDLISLARSANGAGAQLLLRRLVPESGMCRAIETLVSCSWIAEIVNLMISESMIPP